MRLCARPCATRRIFRIDQRTSWSGLLKLSAFWVRQLVRLVLDDEQDVAKACQESRVEGHTIAL